MTNYWERARELPVSDSEYLWALILDMAKSVDLLLAQSQSDKPEVN